MKLFLFQRQSDKLLWCLTTLNLLLSTYAFLITVNNNTRLWCFSMFITFLLHLSKEREWHFSYEPFCLFLFLFFLYSALSIFWADNVEYAWQRLKYCVEVFLGAIIVYSCFRKKNATDLLLKIFIAYSVIGAIVAFIVSGGDFGSDGRIGTETVGVNANSLGYTAALGCIIVFYYLMEYLSCLRLFSFSVNGFMVFASGSRASFLMMLVGCALVLFFDTINKNNINHFIKNMLFCLCCGVGLILVLSLPIAAVTKTRLYECFGLVSGAHIDGSASDRREIIRIGLNVFREHPLLGVGLDNACTYSYLGRGVESYMHNNYVELLASLGSVGFCLYYSSFVYIFFHLVKYFFVRQREKNRIPVVGLALLFSMLLGDMMCVRYFRYEQYFIFAIFFLFVRVTIPRTASY